MNKYSKMKKSVMQHFANGSFVSHVAVLTSATVLAQIINVISMPFLSRLYTPADFGVLSIFSSTVSLLVSISGFRYSMVIPLVRTKRYLGGVLWLSFLLQVLFVMFVYACMLLFSHRLLDTPYRIIYPFCWFIPVAILTLGIYDMLTQWAIREQGFAKIARTKLTQVVVANLLKIVCGVFCIKPAGLIVGDIVGKSCGITTLFAMLRGTMPSCSFRQTCIKRIGLTYRKMFIYETPGILINTAGGTLLPIIIAYFYNPEIVGAYAMATQLLALPSAVIGSAIGQVFIQRVSRAKHDGNAGEVYLKTYQLLFIIGVYPLLLMSLLAPVLLPIILGAKWVLAGRIALLISPWVALNFVYSPISVICTIMMLQKFAFIFVSLYTIVRLLPFYLAGTDTELAFVILSFSGVVFMFIGIFIPAKIIGINIYDMIKITLCLLLKIFVTLVPIIMCCLLNISLLITLSVSLVSIVFYVLLNLSYIKNLCC